MHNVRFTVTRISEGISFKRAIFLVMDEQTGRVREATFDSEDAFEVRDRLNAGQPVTEARITT
jgi:hypothetical protein